VLLEELQAILSGQGAAAVDAPRRRNAFTNRVMLEELALSDHAKPLNWPKSGIVLADSTESP
jgi:hypothetical protein